MERHRGTIVEFTRSVAGTRHSIPAIHDSHSGEPYDKKRRDEFHGCAIPNSLMKGYSSTYAPSAGFVPPTSVVDEEFMNGESVIFF
jgi:hypothetical protein